MRALIASVTVPIVLLALCAASDSARAQAPHCAEMVHGIGLCHSGCPGCNAYFGACGQAFPPAYSSELGTELGADGAPPFDGSPFADEPFPYDSAGEPYGQPNTATDSLPAGIPGGMGAIAASTSSAPSMIGDLFNAGPTATIIFQPNSFTGALYFGPPTSSSDSTDILLSPDNLSTFGDSNLNVVVSGSPMVFSVAGSASGFLSVDGAGSPITPSDVGILPVGGSFQLSTGDGPTQASLVAAAAAQEESAGAMGGQVTLDGGLATLVEEDGFNGIHDQNSNLNPALFPYSDGDLFEVEQFYTYAPDPITVDIPTPGGAPGAVVGRQKLTDNSSPIPRDRFIYNFSYFDNTPLLPSGQNVSRNVFGFEKTFLNNLTSLEVRFPFASTLRSDLSLADDNTLVGGSETEFGNVTLYFKGLLHQTPTVAVGAGLGVALPTADDFTLQTSSGEKLLVIENDSPHLLPYVGFLLTPRRSNFFLQGFAQLDLDTRGNPARVATFNQGAPTGLLSSAGRLDDADYLFVDLGLGYWLYQDPSSRAHGVTGIAPTFELHYNGDIGAGEPLSTGVVRTTGDASFDLVNAVAGGTVMFGQNKQLLFGYATPIGGDEQFDGEFRLSFNWFFGSTSGPRRVSF